MKTAVGKQGGSGCHGAGVMVPTSGSLKGLRLAPSKRSQMALTHLRPSASMPS
ncbi:MAG: hypothetical protein Q4E55_04465 [Bacteroidales bacterium]|nr:hypothetical protein [Bacteroidales bacterium]